MAQRAHRMETASPGPGAPRAARGLGRSGWSLATLMCVIVCFVYIGMMARYWELQFEVWRLERLQYDQSIRHSELLQQREKLISEAVLGPYAAKAGLVPSGESTPLNMGPLPARQVYWRLPGEAGAARPPGAALISWRPVSQWPPPQPGS